MSADTLDRAFLSLVRQFIERQSLVLEAMKDVCPRRLSHMLPRSAPSSTRRNLQDQPQSGVWRDEWNYFWHGIGCGLKNKNTGESIEWDAPVLEEFDRFWLLNWLKWKLAQSGQDENVAMVRSALEASGKPFEDFVYGLLDHLRETEMIVKTTPYNAKWRITPSE